MTRDDEIDSLRRTLDLHMAASRLTMQTQAEAIKRLEARLYELDANCATIFSNHAECIRELGERVNLQVQTRQQPEPRKTTIIHLLGEGDNVVSHPKFRGG